MIVRNKIVIGGLAIIVGVGAWFGLSGDSSSPDLLVTEDFTTAGTASDKDLVATLLQLRAVALEGSIFSDPAFQTLQDFGSQIIPEPVGRLNPFAPLNAGQGKQATSTSPRR
ncbi:MAG: hypothetical protein G01um10148_654 [Parcubacteria group bacterium Gr01-1014_8]|nr:MAG: hypothetical protein G01um10148_654 [Parcubacteria group bacterium Gr01-1014_8]